MNFRSTIGAVLHTAVKRPQRLQNLLRAVRDRPQISLYVVRPREACKEQGLARSIYTLSSLV
jgi:hypothetical protein